MLVVWLKIAFHWHSVSIRLGKKLTDVRKSDDLRCTVNQQENYVKMDWVQSKYALQVCSFAAVVLCLLVRNVVFCFPCDIHRCILWQEAHGLFRLCYMKIRNLLCFRFQCFTSKFTLRSSACASGSRIVRSNSFLASFAGEPNMKSSLQPTARNKDLWCGIR